MKTATFLFGSFVGVLLGASSAHAKRLAPQPVKPVVHAGLRYEAPHWASEHKNMRHNGGYVRIVNARNGLPICLREVYAVKPRPNLEADVQDQFVTSLSVKGQELVIVSERQPLLKIPLAGICGESHIDQN